MKFCQSLKSKMNCESRCDWSNHAEIITNEKKTRFTIWVTTWVTKECDMGKAPPFAGLRVPSILLSQRGKETKKEEKLASMFVTEGN